MNQADFDLTRIANFLEGLEESIIYKLLDRAQFARNLQAYQPGRSGFPGRDGESLLDIRLRFQEEMDARFGRFLVPEERPFLSGLPAAQRTIPPASVFPVPDVSTVSQTAPILARYLHALDALCQPGDDGHLGSSVEHDVAALQSIARRVHFGALYVSEAKFLAQPELFRSLAAAGDNASILDALTRREVEQRILGRVREKIDSIQARVNQAVRRVVDPELIMAFYRDTVIPLTKEGELAYLKIRAARPLGQPGRRSR